QIDRLEPGCAAERGSKLQLVLCLILNIFRDPQHLPARYQSAAHIIDTFGQNPPRTMQLPLRGHRVATRGECALLRNVQRTTGKTKWFTVIVSRLRPLEK